MFAKVAPAGRAYAPSTGALLSSRYVDENSARTVTELLSDEPNLLIYAQRLEEAELDPEMVAGLCLADLREVLEDAPIAHCLRVRQRLSGSTRLRPVIPDSPAYKWQARMVATGLRDGNLKEAAATQHEFDLILGSLFLSFAIAPLLEPPTACADGSSCSGLLAVDILCWVCLITCLMLGVINCWTMALIERCVSSNSMPRWICDNWRIFNLGHTMTIFSFTWLPVALSTRSVILFDGSPSYPWWLVWAVVAILVCGGIVLQYIWWVVICCCTFSIKSASEFIAFNLGVLGLRMPNEQLESAQVQDPVHYMD